MATATETLPVAEVEPETLPVDFTADQFFGMIDAGLFAPERRVFLWGGRIYEKMAKTPSHAITAYIFQESLRSRLPAGWLILNESPIRLDARYVPLPDLAVARGPIQRYRGPLERRRTEDRHPEVPEVGLLAEIAVSSLPKDLGERAQKFAQAAVPCYWVADVFGGRVVEHRDPRVMEGVGSYAVIQQYGLDDQIPLVLDGQEIARIPVRELLG